jgi:50S ribosomal subunit-associated GTPase HflX
LVFNKVDLVDDRRRHEISSLSAGLMVSCATLEGIDALTESIAALLLRHVAHGLYVIPFTSPEARAEVYAGAVVLSERLAARSWIIEAAASAPGDRLPSRFLRRH